MIFRALPIISSLLLLLLVYSQHGHIRQLQFNKLTLENQLEQNQRQMKRLERDIIAINQLAAEAEYAKQQHNLLSQQRQQQIKTQLQTEACNTQSVPAAIADSLQQQARALYQATTDSG